MLHLPGVARKIRTTPVCAAQRFQRTSPRRFSPLQPRSTPASRGRGTDRQVGPPELSDLGSRRRGDRSLGNHGPFELADPEMRPEGPVTIQPRATPWVSAVKTSVALKGRNNSRSIPDMAFIEFYFAPSGRRSFFWACPRALPWAGILPPFRRWRREPFAQRIAPSLRAIRLFASNSAVCASSRFALPDGCRSRQCGERKGRSSLFCLQFGEPMFIALRTN